MGDHTVWTRLEPRPRNEDLTDALRAPVRDPLWLLSRQWQVSEFRGEDAGSPARIDIDVAEDALARIDHRGGGRDETDPIDYEGGPLEATVEREAVTTDEDGPPLRVRVEAGQQFLRMLADAGYGEYAAADFPDPLRLDRPDESLPAADRRYVELLADRALDGAAVARAIRTAVADADAVVEGTADWGRVTTDDLPLPTDGSRTDAFDDAAGDFYRWYTRLFDEPTAESGSAWDPTRLEYRFAVATGRGDQETVLEAEEYRGGRLDWYSFSVAGNESLAPATGRSGLLGRGSQGGDAPSLAETHPGLATVGPIDTEDIDLDRVTETLAAIEDDLDRSTIAGGALARNVTAASDVAQNITEVGDSDGDTGSGGHDTIDIGRLVRLIEDRTGGQGAPVAGSGSGTEDTAVDVGSLLDVDASTVRRSETAVPTRLSFPGAPEPRWWTFEDGDVDVTRVTDDGASIPRLLLVEFAAQYGNDWYRIDLETPVGTLTRLTELTVTDSFGVSESARLAADEDCRLFAHNLPNHDESGLFLPPTLPGADTGDTVEEVTFARDETANLAFAVERTVEGPTGRPIDRSEFQVPRLVVDRVNTAADPDEEFIELVNPGEDRLVVDGYRVVAEQDGTTTEVYAFGERRIDPGGSVRIYTGTPPDTDALAGGFDRSMLANVDAVRIEDAGGRPVATELLARPDAPMADYRLSTEVPDHWFPFTPERGWRRRLERALLLDAETLGTPIDRLPRPLGEILRPPEDSLPEDTDTYRLYDEAIPRSGLAVTRRYQHARWTDGASHLWSGRETRPAETRPSSDLGFDVLQERDPQQ